VAWAKLFKRGDMDRRIYLIGNKMDLEPTYDFEDKVEELERTCEFQFHKASAKSGENVENIFLKMTKEIVEEPPALSFKLK
jgi:hypothetical protein